MNWLTRLVAGRPGLNLDDNQRQRLEACAAIPDIDLGRPHAESRYVIVNTGASGLDVDHDHLLTVAAIAIDGGTLDPHQAFDAELEPAPAEALISLLEFIGKSPLVVFNAPFNRTMLTRAFERHLGADPDLAWIDLYWLLPSLFPERIDAPARLKDWAAAFGIETFRDPPALADAFAISQLHMAALARALGAGLTNPRSLVETERSRRWLRQSS